MVTNVSRRFPETTEEEIQTKRLKLNADNRLKANKKSANILRDSLFENYDTVRLNETLAHFYTKINRYLKWPPHDEKFDIVKDSDFTDVNTIFLAAMSEIKPMGLAENDHHPVIN